MPKTPPPLLPTPVLSLLTRSVRVGGVDYPIALLSDPRHAGDLAQDTAAQLRQLIFKRLTNNGRYVATLRTLRVGATLPLSDDYSARLSPAARIALRSFLQAAPFESLAERTWGDFFDKRRGSGPRIEVLAAMAELEGMLAEEGAEQTEGSVAEAWPALLQKLLADDRIDTIQPNDLRFGWKHLDGAPNLRTLLARWVDDVPAPTTQQRSLVQRLADALRRSFRDDVDDIAQSLAVLAYANRDARHRAAEAFAARHGMREYGPELEAIAKRHGTSGSRASQLEAILLAALRQESLASPAATALVRRAEALAYLDLHDIERALGLAPGNGHSLRTLRRFCLRVLRPAVAFDLHPHRAMRERRTGITSTYHEAGMFKGAVRVAQGLCRAAGAANITQVAGALALDTGRAIDRAALVAAVEGFPAMRWLDQQLGWFVLDELETSLVYPRVRKILAVAREGVTIREIGEALWRSLKLADESGGEVALAPMRILKAAILGWPDRITEDSQGRLQASVPIDIATALSPAEQQLFRALAAAGGIGNTTRLGRNVDVASVAALLADCPFVEPLGHAVYALRGWPIDARSILAAFAERVAIAQKVTSVPEPGRAPMILRIQ